MYTHMSVRHPDCIEDENEEERKGRRWWMEDPTNPKVSPNSDQSLSVSLSFASCFLSSSPSTHHPHPHTTSLFLFRSLLQDVLVRCSLELQVYSDDHQSGEEGSFYPRAQRLEERERRDHRPTEFERSL